MVNPYFIEHMVTVEYIGQTGTYMVKQSICLLCRKLLNCYTGEYVTVGYMVKLVCMVTLEQIVNLVYLVTLLYVVTLEFMITAKALACNKDSLGELPPPQQSHSKLPHKQDKHMWATGC